MQGRGPDTSTHAPLSIACYPLSTTFDICLTTPLDSGRMLVV